MKKLTLFLGLVFCSHILAEVELIDVHQLKERIENSKEALILLDVRTIEEYQSGHIKDSISLPHVQKTTHSRVLQKWAKSSIGDRCFN